MLRKNISLLRIKNPIIHKKRVLHVAKLVLLQYKTNVIYENKQTFMFNKHAICHQGPIQIYFLAIEAVNTFFRIFSTFISLLNFVFETKHFKRKIKIIEYSVPDIVT